MRFLFPVLVLAILFSGCASPEVHNEQFSKYCTKATDCVSETVLNPGCSHYCADDCTEGMRFCEVYYKNSEGNKNLAQNRCFWNEPCREPSSVECVNDVCVVS